MLNRKVVTIVLSLALFSSGVFYVASAKNDGSGGSPWESILAVFVTGGEVNISRPVVLDPGTHIDVSGSTVDVSGSSVDVTGSIDVSGSVDVSGSTVDVSGSSVDVTGTVSLETGTTVDVSGEVSLASGAEVEISGPVSLAYGTEVEISEPVSLAPDTEVITRRDTWNQPVFHDLVMDPGQWNSSLFYIVNGFEYVYIAKSSNDYLMYVEFIWEMPNNERVTQRSTIDGVSARGVYTVKVKAPMICIRLWNPGSSAGGEISVVFYAVS